MSAPLLPTTGPGRLALRVRAGWAPSRLAFSARVDSRLGHELMVTRAEETTKRETLRCRDWPRHVERGPAVAPLDVGAAPASLEQMEMQEGLASRVEDAG